MIIIINTTTIPPTTPPTMPTINPTLEDSSSGTIGASSTIRYQGYITPLTMTESPVSRGGDRGESAHPPAVHALYATLTNDNI